MGAGPGAGRGGRQEASLSGASLSTSARPVSRALQLRPPPRSACPSLTAGRGATGVWVSGRELQAAEAAGPPLLCLVLTGDLAPCSDPSATSAWPHPRVFRVRGHLGACPAHGGVVPGERCLLWAVSKVLLLSGSESLTGRGVYYPLRSHVMCLPETHAPRRPWGTKGSVDLCGKTDLLCTDMGGETACPIGLSGPRGSVRPAPAPRASVGPRIDQTLAFRFLHVWAFQRETGWL